VKTARIEQLQTLHVAFGLVRDWSAAIDGGANQGDWAAEMASRFQNVYAFEPADDMAELCARRFSDQKNVAVAHKALWNVKASVSIHPPIGEPTKTLARYVQPGGDIDAVAIDDLGLPSCGLIKLDLEGAELLALEGAISTLSRYRPVVIVECKNRLLERFGASKKQLLEFLSDMGAREVHRLNPDRIFAWL